VNKKSVGGGPDASGLVVESGALDFGLVWETPDLRWMLPITNTRDTAVQVARFSSTCSCSQISPPSLELAPGETQSVSLTLDLRSAASEEPAKDTLPVSITLTPILTSGGVESKGPSWEVIGRVKRSLRLSTPFVGLGQHSELAQPLQPTKFLVQTCNEIDDLVVSGPSNISIKTLRATNDPRRYELTIQPTNRFRIGHIDQELEIAPTSQGTKLPPRKVSIRGKIVEDIVFSPTEVLFGARSIGTNSSEVVTLRSLTGTAFEVLDVRANGPGVRANPTDAGYLVGMQVLALGQANGSVVFRIRRADGVTRVVPLGVSCFGIEKSSDN
jgi:hypothetical protein